MGFRNIVNYGSSNEPRLRLQQSTAGIRSLDGENATSIAQILDRIVGAGFSGFEANCRSEQEADELAVMLRDRGLAIGFSADAADVDDLVTPLELSHRMRADYLSVRVLGSLKASPEIAEILEEMYDLANDAGLPLFIQTRGGSVMQDLRRTVKVINRFKKIRFAGDFSDYLAASQLGAEWSEEVWDHFRRIARRCENWHGALVASHSDLTQQIKKLWTVGTGDWLSRARPGDVLPFSCEPSEGGWEQCLAIKRLAEEAWVQAKVEQKPEENHVTVELPNLPDIAVNQGMH
jgi:hypothetical protein